MKATFYLLCVILFGMGMGGDSADAFGADGFAQDFPECTIFIYPDDVVFLFLYPRMSMSVCRVDKVDASALPAVCCCVSRSVALEASRVGLAFAFAFAFGEVAVER